MSVWLAGARSLLQQGEANPERAYGEAQMATQRGLRDVERTAGISERPGMRESELSGLPSRVLGSVLPLSLVSKHVLRKPLLLACLRSRQRSRPPARN